MADADCTSSSVRTLRGLEQPVRATVDPYSDRVRCDHPAASDGRALGVALHSLAVDTGLGRVVALTRPGVAEGLIDAGYSVDGVMPGFYGGGEDCVVSGRAVDPARARLANPLEVERVDSILASAPPASSRPIVATRLADADDAPAIAALLGDTFAEYPTPSAEPAYIAEQIETGTPFRIVTEHDEVVACASADRVSQARTAELTDCATLPSHRGRGYMQFILSDLIDDVRVLGYPTVFTLARARIPGVNLAFMRLGFELRGRMARSCRIGAGLEDMNIWSRGTDEAHVPTAAAVGAQPAAAWQH